MDSPPDFTDSNDSYISDGLSPSDLFRLSKWELMHLDNAKINWEAWNRYNLSCDRRSRLVALASTLHNSSQNESWTIVPLMELHTLTKKYEYISEILKLKKLEERRAANQHIDNWTRLITIQIIIYAYKSNSLSVVKYFNISYTWITEGTWNSNRTDCIWRPRDILQEMLQNIEFNNSEIDGNYFSKLRSLLNVMTIHDIALIKVFNFAAERYQKCKEAIYESSTKWMTENNSDHIVNWLNSITNINWWNELWTDTNPFNLFGGRQHISTINTIRERKGVGWSMLITILYITVWHITRYKIDGLCLMLTTAFKLPYDASYNIRDIVYMIINPTINYPPIETIKDKLITCLEAHLHKNNDRPELHKIYIKEFVRYLQLLSHQCNRLPKFGTIT